MTTTSDSHAADASYFSGILQQDSRDAGGRTYLEGLIDYCQEWRTHRAPHALEHLAAYLFDGSENDANYERLCHLAEGEFLQAKAIHHHSVFPVLDDVRLLSDTARARGDLERYGMSLGLRARLWQKGVRRAEVGLVVLLGHRGFYSEAIANAVYGRSPREAFDILAMLLGRLPAAGVEAWRAIGDAMLDCVSRMDNEGQRAHHIHRALYAVRLLSESCAADLIQRCAELADSIADEFQHVVAYVLLVQQVSPLNLNTAEQLSRQVVRAAGEYFAGEGGDALLAIAAIGRGTESSGDRKARLERLVELAGQLKQPEASLRVITTLLLELHWENPSQESLARALKAYESWLAACPDKRLSDVLKALTNPEPVRVNNAKAPYHDEGMDTEDDEDDAETEAHGKIGTVEARTVGEAFRLCPAGPGIDDLVSGLATGTLQRVSRIEDPDEWDQRFLNLLKTLAKLAGALSPAAGRRLLQYAERLANEYSDSFEATQRGIELAASWYSLDAPEQGRVLLRRGMDCLHRCHETFRAFEDDDEQEQDSESDGATAQSLSGTREEISRETVESRISHLSSALAESLQRIPIQYRLAAFDEIAAILSPDRPGYLSLGGDEEAVVRALADVDLEQARRVVEGIGNWFVRYTAGAALAEYVGGRDPGAGIAIVDRLAHVQASAETAERICNLCVQLHPFEIPQAFWEQLSRRLDVLEEHSYRTVAMHFCAVRVAETSPRVGLEIARREWKRCANRESETVKDLAVLVQVLGFVTGETIRLEDLVQTCTAREKRLGARTKKLILHRVVPRAARQDPHDACVLLRVSGDLQEDCSPVADLVLVLLSEGNGDAALSILRCLPEILASIPAWDRDSAIWQFLERLASGAVVPDADEEARVWSWLMDRQTGVEASSLSANAALLDVVRLARVSPKKAITEWTLRLQGDERIVDSLIRLSLRTNTEETIAAIAALPEGTGKAALLAAVYAGLARSTEVRPTVEIPSPLPLLRHLPTPEAQGDLLANYLLVVGDLTADEALTAIKNLPPTESRQGAVRAAIRQFSPTHQDELLAIIAETVAARARGPEEEPPDDSLRTWAQLAAQLSFDAGVEILREIESDFDRYTAAEEILESIPEITVEKISALLVGLDGLERSWLARHCVARVAFADLERAEQLVTAIDPLEDYDRSRCLEAAREEHFKESVRRDPDGAIERIAGLSDASEQAKQLETVLEILKDAGHASAMRWDLLLGIIGHWSRSAQALCEALDYESIGEIAHFAPDIAYERILARPAEPKNAEACMRLLQHIRRPEHVALLRPALDGYRRYLLEADYEQIEIRRMAGGECRAHLQKRIKHWDAQTADAAAPIVVEALRDLPGLNGQRDKLVLGLLSKVSVENIGLLVKLCDMLESPATRYAGSMIVARRSSADGLQKFMEYRDAGDSRPKTAAGQASALLGRIVEEAVGASLFAVAEAAEPVSPGATGSEMFALILDVYPLLCRLPASSRQRMRLEICKLLQSVLAQEEHDDPLVAILLHRSSSNEGMMAEDAGIALASFLSSLARLPETSGKEEAEAIIRLLTQGNPSRALSPTLGPAPALLQKSGAGDLVEQLLLRGGEYPCDIPRLVEQLLSTWAGSYTDTDECFVKLEGKVEELRSADPRIRLQFGRWLLGWVESAVASSGEEHEALKRCVPILRVYVASELFLPEYIEECLHSIGRGLDELLAYAEADELPQELFQSLTRTGYAIGKMIYLRGCPPEMSVNLQQPLKDILLYLAELEYNASRLTAGEDLTRIVTTSCRTIISNLDGLSTIGTVPDSQTRFWKLHRRRQALIENLLNTLRCAPWKSADHAGRGLLRRIGEDENNDSEGEWNAVGYLYILAGCFWKAGWEDSNTTSEIVEIMCQLAATADTNLLEKEGHLFKVNERFEVEMFVRMLARIDREGALRFVEATAAHDDEGDDLGLFDELVVDDPTWVFAHLDRIGTKDTIRDRVRHLLVRMVADTPREIPKVSERIQQIMQGQEDWTIRSEIAEALGTALAGIGSPEMESIRRITPEFWARATIGAASAKEAWACNPLGALKIIDELELADVRADALMQCARQLPLADAEGDTLVAVRALLVACQRLPGEQERLRASRESLLAAMRLGRSLERTEALDLACSFLELFSSASPDWLRLAFVVSVPILAEYLEIEQLSQIGRNMFSASCHIDTQPLAVELCGG